eukprot:GAHX01002787.1.p1 GENE.GAHX01002787.1~~GAHX01002787.1.p1  ORF type:complete len:454 (-),score=73.16 GAHX01002787.1:68-1429(-)
MYLKVAMSYILSLFAILNVCILTGKTGYEEIQNKTLTEKEVEFTITSPVLIKNVLKSMGMVHIEPGMPATDGMQLPYLLKNFPKMLSQEIKCSSLQHELPTENNLSGQTFNYLSDSNGDRSTTGDIEAKCNILGQINEQSIENEIDELPLSVSVYLVLQLFTDFNSQNTEYEQLTNLAHDALDTNTNDLVNDSEIKPNNNKVNNQIFEPLALLYEKTYYLTSYNKDSWLFLLASYITRNFEGTITTKFDFFLLKNRFNKFFNSEHFKTFEKEFLIEKDKQKLECISCSIETKLSKGKESTGNIKEYCDHFRPNWKNENESYCSNFFNKVIEPKYLEILNTKNNITELENTLELLTSKIEQYNRKDQSNDNIANILNLENDEKSTNVYFETFLLNTMLFRKELDIKINDLKREVSNLLRSYIKQNFLIYKHIIDMRLLINSALASKRKSNIDLK